METTWKRLLSWLLVITMVLSMVPVMDLSNFTVRTKASGTEATTQTETLTSEAIAAKKIVDAIDDLGQFAPPAGTATTIEKVCPVCSPNKEVAWTAIGSDHDGTALSTGHYYLIGNVTKALSPKSASATQVCLNLNGYNVTVSDGKVFDCNYCKAFNIMDSAPTDGVVSGYYNGERNGATIHLRAAKANANVNIYGGTFEKITKSNDKSNQSSVVGFSANGGTLIMYGGTIKGTNSSSIQNASYPAAVYMEGGSTGNGGLALFEMRGGKIIGGTSNTSTDGGSIRVGFGAASNAHFKMYGGTVSGGKARAGGNFFVNYSTLSIFGGTVEGGQSTSGTSYLGGGNVLIANGGTLDMSGGTITGGKATKGCGGNILIRGTNRGDTGGSYGTVNISGGKILDGEAHYEGDNIFVDAKTNTTKSALNISGSAQLGGGICTGVNATVTLSGTPTIETSGAVTTGLEVTETSVIDITGLEDGADIDITCTLAKQVIDTVDAGEAARLAGYLHNTNASYAVFSNVEGEVYNCHAQNTTHYVVDKEASEAATCTENGTDVYVCDVCGDAYTKTISAGHTGLTQVAAKEPNCTEVGYEAYEHCTDCDYTTYKEIPATGHKFDDNFDNECNNCNASNPDYTASVAQIGETKYESLQAALAAAQAMTGDVTVEIYDKVTMNAFLSGSYDSITFVGKDTDAEIYMKVQGYITATGKKVAFEDLTLSKSEGGFITNAGFMNVAFGVYDVTEVTYTDCTFANGAYAAAGKVTYTGCTFKRSWDKYGLWAYGDVEITVDGCTFADYRGIKMYAEGAAKTVDLTVKNTDFSAVNDKPAIVLTYGESVTLENNTYSSTGAFELDLDGAPNGTAVSTDVYTITCKNDNGVCGVLVDGKIYTTVAQAAEVATSGSTVTLLHASTETVELAEGVILNKNGYTADGVSIAASAVAKVGDDYYTDLQEAIVAAAPSGTVELLSDVTVDKWIMFAEKLSIGNGNIITLNINGLTINGNSRKLTVKDIESARNGNRLFFDAQNLNINDLTIEYVDAAANLGGIGLTSGTIKNVEFIGGGYGVLPGAGDVTIEGCTFKTNSTAIYYEDERDNLVVTGNAFELDEDVNVILLRGATQFTNNTVTSGRTVNVVSGSPVVSGNNFNDVRFKVYNQATATISDNTINNLVFNEPTAVANATFANNTLSAEAQAALDAVTPGLRGSGIQEDPYLIENLEDLIWFRDEIDEQAADGSTQFAGKYFKLTADIDLAGINWNPIGSMTGDHGSFKGVFDGDGHTIYNLNCQQAGNGLGLFARTAGNAEIKNLTLENVTVKSTDNSNYVGAVVGNSYASTKITNVHVTGAIDISGRGYIGGISGHGYVVMDNVSVVGEGTISSTFWCAGGILGYAGEGATNIMNAKVEGTGETGLTVTSAAGGLGAIVGMAEDNKGTQPISGSNLSAKNVNIKTYTGAYGDAYANYALGYLYGGNPTSILTGNLSVEDVTIETSNGEEPEVNDAVADVEGTIYFSLQAAIDAAGENDTVIVLRDVTLTDTLTVPAGKTITLDLNGQVIDGEGKVRIAVMTYGDLTVKDSSDAKTGAIKAGIDKAGNTVNVCGGTFTLESGSIYSRNNALLIDEQAATVNIKGGSVTAEPTTGNSAVMYVSSTSESVINIEGGELVGYNGILLWDNTEINMTGGSIEAKGSLGIQGNGSKDNTKISISGDASISGYYAAIYHPQDGELNISENATLTGWTGVVVKGGDVTISGGTISGTGAADAYRPVSSGFVDTGDGLYIEHYDDSPNSENYGTPTMTVTGGTFTSANAKAVASYANPNNDVEALTGFISGGTFGMDVTAYCAPGYKAEANGDGTYGVKRGLRGSGTEADPYQIGSVDDLILFRDSVNAGEGKYNNAYVILTADIDLSSVANWTPIGNVTYDSKYVLVDTSKVFSGVFDGNDKVISNLAISKTVGGVDTQANVGLFGITGEDAVIKDLTLTNVNIVTDGRNVGALAGFAYKATLENITVNGNVQIKGGNNVAGVCGMTRYYDLSATNISVSGNAGSAIVGNNIVGGIFAEIAPNGSKQTFKNLSVENVNITGSSGVGGIVGLLTLGTVDTVSVKDIVITANTLYQGDAMGRIRMGSVAGLMGNKYATIAKATVENVTAKNLDGNAVVLPIIGANYDASSNATEAKIGNKYYATLAEAVKATTAGDTITLLAPIVVNAGETLTLDKDVTITYTSDVVGEDMITVRGTLNVAAGKITYVNNSNGTNVTVSTISAEPGSVVNVTGGTIENKSVAPSGSSSYAYAIDILTNGSLGDVTVDISGGTVSSDYVAIRQFNNGDACKNTLNVSGGNIYGAKRAIQIHFKNNAAYLTISGGVIEAAGDYALCFLTTSENLAVSGGKFTGSVWYSGTAGFISGGTFGTDVTEFCAPGYKAEANGDGTYGIQVTLPEVAITDIKGTLTGEDPDLTFALNFAIPNVEELSEEYLNELFEAYGNYYVDYVLTINGLNGDTVTFNANGNADGYLAGQYDAWGENWVSVPFEDVVVEDGKGLYIMEYAAKLMGKTGLRFTLAEVATIVQNFDCGVYFTPEFMAEHPDLEVSLVLKVFTEDAEGTKIENIDVATNQFENNYAAAVSGEGKQTVYYATFAEAYNAAQNGDTVELLKDVKLTGKLTVAKSITIDGNGCSIIADETAVWYTVSGKLNIKNYKTHLLGINADGITLKDVVLDCNNNAAGINVYCAQNVIFDNVQIINATKGMAGLTVNGSTLTAKNALTISGNAIAVDISNGSGVTSALGVTIEDGTVTDLGNKTVKFASAANNNMTGAVDASGNAYFAAMDNAYYYTQAQIDSRTTGYTNGLTLLEDVTLSKDVTISGTLDLNGHNLSIAEGKSLKVNGNLTVTGEGSITGNVVLTTASATLTAPEGLNVTTSVEGYEVVYKNGVYSLTEIVYVAQIGTTKYETLAEALTAAQDGETVQLLWAEGDAPIAMNGAVYGKSVTITGTATVDWNKGFLFIGRGGEGNGAVTFENANLTSASNSASYGIHVSGREKNTTNKYDGTLIIKNSTIELDYLINKGTMALDNSTLTVKNGFSVGGRPANETESGEDATATLNLTNGSKVIVNNHNGMGLGYEAIGVMNIDATSAFECTQKFLVTAKGTMNIAGTAKVEGLLTNDGTINLTAVDATLTTAEAPVVTTTVEDYKVVYADGAYKLTLKQVAQNTTTGKIYPTLQAAIDEAAAGETIQVLENIELTGGITVAADKQITLDLNGKTVSMETADDAKYCLIYNNGDLAITDSGENGKLSYLYTGTNSGDAYNTIESAPGSVLTVQDGTIENLSPNCLIAYAIDGLTNGSAADVTVNIEGGKITSKKIAVRIFANSTTKTGTLNISGGEISGRVIIQNANANANKAVLNITGGTFNSNGYKTDVLYVGGSNGATGDIAANVSGGAFNGEILSSINKGFITGGIFTANAKENTNEDLLALARQFAENTDASTKEQYPYGVEVNEKIVAWNMQTGTEYETVALGLAAAKSGETVQMLVDCSETVVFVYPGVTLDLNGCKLTAAYVAADFVGSNIIDGSENNAGLLVVAEANANFAMSNKQLPIKTPDGYRLADTTVRIMLGKRDNGIRVTTGLMADSDLMIAELIKAHGLQEVQLQFRIKLDWTGNNGNAITQYFRYSDNLHNTTVNNWLTYASGYNAGGLGMTVTGAEGLSDLSFTGQLVLLDVNGRELVVFESDPISASTVS